MGVNYKGAIERFNPYVAQIPIEAYTKVGMFKQQQEEAGIQKIQSTIDNIAGLDMAKQSGKDYLQTRVNELTNTLNKFGNADVSNPDNIRNLQSLATPIYQDMNIQSEVANTMQYRQLVKDQQDALKSGKAEDFSVGYEQEEKVKPWLNSKVVGDSFNGGTRTLRGTVDEARKMFSDEMAKFKPDVYKTQSSANPMFEVQTETGYTTMDKRRLTEYVMGTMSGDTQELLKRKSWYENVGASGETLIKKTIQTVSNETSDMLAKAEQYSNLAKIHSNNSSMSKEYEQLSTDYKTRHDDILTKTKDELSKMDPRNLTKQQKEGIYSRLGISNFASSLAEGLGYSETDTKQLENPVWKTVFQADKTSLDNAVSSKNFDVSPEYDKNGKFAGFNYTNNVHKHDKTTTNADGTTTTGELNADGTPKVYETNVALPAGAEDAMKWDYPTYDKITDNFKATQGQITTGIYTFLKQANIDADKYFVKSYEKSANGNGMNTNVSIKKGSEKEVTNLIAALETAVDAELTQADVTSKIETSLKSGVATGVDGLNEQLNALTPAMRDKFMPALKYITEDKSGKAYMKDVLEKKKQYGNQRAALANIIRQFGEVTYGGDPEFTKKLASASDDELLSYKRESEGGFNPDQNKVYTKIEKVDGRYVVNTYKHDISNFGDMSTPGADSKTGESKVATEEDAKRHGYDKLNDIGESGFTNFKNHNRSVTGQNSNTFFDDKFAKEFDTYLKDNVSKKTENIFSTVFSGMLSKVGTAQKESMLRGIMTSEGLPVTDDIIKNASFSIAGYTNKNPDNPLDKQAKLLISYTVKDAKGKEQAMSLPVDMQKFLDVNKDPNHPLQKLFKLNDYMSEATTIMMDPYHGSRLNDSIKDWNIISDTKGNKAMKYRVIWTGDNNTNAREVGMDAKIPEITEKGKAYVEMYVPGKGKVLLKDFTTGSTASYTHPALALEFLHRTFEKSTEKELDEFYKYLNK